METVVLEGDRIATYTVIGEGTPTLMIPGGPGFSAMTMRPDARLFSDVLQCFLVDPPGSGGSSPPADPSGYSVEAHARFYDAARTALGLGEVIAFGHSFGGSVALTLAALRPNEISACVTVAPYGVGDHVALADRASIEEEWDRNLTRHASRPGYAASRDSIENVSEKLSGCSDGAEAAALLADAFPLWTAWPDRPSTAAALSAIAGGMKLNIDAQRAWQAGMFQTYDPRPAAAAVRCPWLIVTGKEDFCNGPAQARILATQNASARLEVIDDCGHFVPVEAPERYRQLVTEFLARRG